MSSLPKIRRRAPDAKHASLLDAAIKAFSEQGFTATSMAGIAKRAGVAVGTIYRFYPDKISLLAALHDQVEAEIGEVMQASWAQGGAYEHRLDRMIVDLFAFFAQRRAVLSILSMTTDIGSPDGALPADAIRQIISEFLSEGIDAKVYRSEDPDMLAALVHGAVEGVMKRFLVGRATQANAVASTQAFLRRAVVGF